MDKNIQSIIPECLQPKREMKQASSPFDKIRFPQEIQRFLKLIRESKHFQSKYFSKCFRFKLLNRQQSLKQLDSITAEVFDKAFKELQPQFHHLGISIIKRKLKNGDLLKITFRFTEPIIFADQEIKVEEEQSSNCNEEEQIVDDFPKDEQIQQIMRNKDERMKGFAKPNVILSKAQSDGLLGTVNKRRNFDENSLQVQLYEQDLFSTPLGINRKNTSSNRQPEQEQGQSFVERANAYKENYQKCSKLIDNAMIQILTAHRHRKIGDKADELLDKVIEIYDLLSDNIENVNATVREFEGKGADKKESQIASPGFKPLNGMNDNMK